MKEDKSNMYLLAIVAIVAIVALVVMFMMNGRTNNLKSDESFTTIKPVFIDEEGNMIGYGMSSGAICAHMAANSDIFNTGGGLDSWYSVNCVHAK